MTFHMPASLSLDNHILAGCDRCILNLFGPCLRKINDGEFQLAQFQPILLQVKQALEQGGIVCLTSAGEVKFMTPKAGDLIHKYFPGPLENGLPELLKKKIIRQLRQASSTHQDLSLELLSRVESQNDELLLYLVEDPKQQQHFLLLEEKTTITFSVHALELLGLTRREAEVLFWVTKDKSNASIAKTIGCCEGTVRKHLENIYKKLEVQTRIGAVMSALQQLGLLKGEPIMGH